MARRLLRFLNGTVTWIEMLALIMIGAYAGFSLWDNQQVYNAADDAVAELRQLRAEMDFEENVSLMDQLLAEYEAEQAAKAAGTGTGAARAENGSGTGTTGTGDSGSGGQNANAAGTGSAAADQAGGAGAGSGTEGTTASQAGSAGTGSAAAGTAEGTEPAGASDSEPIAETANGGTTAAGETTQTVKEDAAAGDAAAENMETPAAEPAEKTPFQKLLDINPDITAWITVPGTAIDYPVLQGSSNYSYINTDVHGNFALAGSIFLDSRNAKDYTDKYSLLYGHNMDQHRMFSDINLFKDKEFFDEHRMGMMLMEDGAHLIESLSAIVVPASDSGLFNPENWTDYSGEEILQKVQENTLYINERGLQALQDKVESGGEPKIISLSTCSDEFTDARTILLTLLDP